MKSFISTDPQSHKGKTDVWLTPLDLINRIGDFDFDPCPYPGHKTAKNLCSGDGLKEKWKGKVWLNPPYSQADLWMEKLLDHGWGASLLFARTGSKWIQKYLRSADEICFIKGRISFMKPDGSYGHNAGCDSMILFYGMSCKDRSLGVFR